MIPFYVWPLGAIGMIGAVINVIILLREFNNPLELEPSANLKELPKNDSLYQSFLVWEKKPIEEVYQTCLNQSQLLLIEQYFPRIVFSIGLLMIPMIYWVAEWIRLNSWDYRIFIFIGIGILPLSWLISFVFRLYGFIFLGLLLSWGIFAISLSGVMLPPDTLLFFSIVIYFIGLCLILMTGNEQKSEDTNLLGLIAFSMLIIFALSAIRYFLPLLGSFTILLVIPAILILAPAMGCFSFLAVPTLIILSAIAEHFILIFPNSLAVSGFFSLDVSLIILILIPFDQVKNLLDELSMRLGITQENNLPFPCQKCGCSMEYINRSEIDNYLSHPQQVARSIDSMEYIGFRCPQCYQLESAIHLRGYLQNKGHKQSGSWFETCPTCQEQTMICTKNLIKEYPSKFAGTNVNNKDFKVERKCACCGLVDSHNASTREIK